MKQNRMRRVILTAAVASIPLTSAWAANKSWTFNGSSTWSGVSNWQGGLPGANDIASILSNDSISRTVTLDISTPALQGLSIGNAGSGSNTLLQSSNFNLNAAFLTLGESAGSKGALTQSNGTDTYTNFLTVGSATGSAGTYSLSGSGVLNAFGEENIGFYGSGTFNQSGGTHALGSIALPGNLSIASHGGNSTYFLSGGTVNVVGTEYLGSDTGLGSFNQSGGIHNVGTTSSLGFLHVGEWSTGIGFYVLNSTGSLNVFGTVEVGHDGPGTFTQSGGTHNLGSSTSAGNLYLGTNGGGSGTYLLSGTGVLNAFGIETIGNYGNGTFFQSGGTHTLGSVDSPAILTIAAHGGNSTYFLSSGTFNIVGQEYMGSDTGRGTFSQSGGVHNVGTTSSAGFLHVGEWSTGTGNYLLSGTGSLNVFGTVEIGHDGPGSFTHSAGTHTIGSASSIGSLVLGANAGGSGTYSLSGTGVLNVFGYEDVGGLGIGTFIQSGGTQNLGNLDLGTNAGSKGTYSLSSSGVLNVIGFENIGGLGIGNFIQSDGTHNLGSGGLATLIVNRGTYSLSGGQLNASGREFIGNGSFLQSGGTHNFGSATIFSEMDLGHFASTVGTYSLSGNGVLNTFGIESIGQFGTGNFIQTGGTHTLGSATSFSEMELGYHAGSAGTYSLSGSGVLSLLDGGEIIGADGAGTFVHGGGTHNLGSGTVPGYMYLGAPNGLSGSGTYLLGGTGVLNAVGSMVIGYVGTGNFLQSGGTHNFGLTANSAMYLGYLAGSAGTYSLGGAGMLNAVGTEYIGNAGVGTFIQTGGTHTLGATGLSTLTLGRGSGSTGTYALSGGVLNVFGREQIGNSLFVGSFATGNFIQSGGTHNVGSATNSFSEMSLGHVLGSIGTYSLGGTGVLNAFGIETIGEFGTGNFVQSAGTHNLGSAVHSAEMDLAYHSGSAGTYALSGTGVLNAFGIEGIGASGPGTFNQSGGAHNLGSAMAPAAMYVGAETHGNGTYSLSGTGVLSAFGTESIGNAGTGNFVHSGGTNNLGSAAAPSTMTLGRFSASAGTYSLSGSGALKIFGNEYIGDSGTGNFIQSGGTHNLGSNQGGFDLYVGNQPGSSGTYSLSNSGKLIAQGSEHIGFSGTGTFIQSGGTHNLGFLDGYSILTLGDAAGSAGTYLLSGSGSLQVFGFEVIGYSGTGNFIQTGGTHNLGTVANNHFGDDYSYLFVGDISSGTFALSGGAFNVIGFEAIGYYDGGTGNFIQSGGTHTLGSVEVTSYGSAMVLGSGAGTTGTYSLSGGVLNVIGNVDVGQDPFYGVSKGVLNITGGTMSVSNLLTVWNSPNTAVNLSGGRLTAGSVTNNGFFNQTGGVALLGNIDNSIAGTGSIALSGNNGGSLTASRIRQNRLSITGASGVKITAKATANDPTGTSVVSSYSIAGSGRLDLTNNSMIVDYSTLGTLLNDTRQHLLSVRLLSSSATPSKGIGYADAAAIYSTFPQTFAGQAIDSTSLLIKYTWFGDASLDGVVDVRDLSLAAQHWNTNGNFWSSGDFNYDGAVNITDLKLLAANWGAGSSGSPSQLAPILASLGLPMVEVPEPIFSLSAPVLLAWSFKRPRRLLKPRAHSD